MAPITEEEIQDRAKSNAFIKSVFFIQLGYFCVTVIARAVQHLPISLLELGTLSYAALSAAAGLLQFRKPKSVGNVVVLKHLTPDDPQVIEVSDIICGKPDKVDENASRPVKDLRVMKLTGPDTRVTTGIKSDSAGMAILIISGCFGAIHLAAWNFAFPSEVEKWLWRSASIMASSGLLVGILGLGATVVFYTILEAISKKFDDSTSFADGFTMLVGGAGALIWSLAYLLARLLLIVEMFRGLFYLPPQAFQSTWTTNLPGFG